MKGILRTLGLLGTFVFIVPSFAEEPGGTRTWYVYFDVTDQAGVGLSGISIELIVTTWYGDELDLDGNGIHDSWEMPLAQQFCPYLILHSGDNGVRPVPVESMDRNGNGVLDWEDVLVRCYNLGGQYVGELYMDELLIYGGGDPYLFDVKYPRLAPAEKYFAIPDINGNGIFGESGEALTYYFMIPHYEWGPIGSTTPPSWYSSWSSLMQTHASETAYVNGTTYAHLFRTQPPIQDETVIQYWFFYPFNAAANRHEGDWEHINVILDSQNPSAADIIRVEYYFHERVAPRYTTGVDYYLVNNTHPKVYVGGFTNEDGYSGHGTHGSYPFDGVWPDINQIHTTETVNGLGLHINFANYQNIIIIPNLEATNLGTPLEWVQFGAYWGHALSSPSAGDNFGNSIFDITFFIFPNIPFGQPWFTIAGFGIWDAYTAAGYDPIQDSKIAPLGPALKKNTWNKVYSQTGLTVYTQR